MPTSPYTGRGEQVRLWAGTVALCALGTLCAAFVALALVLQADAGPTAAAIVRTILTSAVLWLLGRARTRRGLTRNVDGTPMVAFAALIVGGLLVLAFLPGRVLLGAAFFPDTTLLAAVFDTVLWSALSLLGVLWGVRSAPERTLRATPYG